MQKVIAKLKSIARRILGAIARPVLRRLPGYTHMREELDEFSSAWHQHIPAVLNTVASVSAIAREQARMKREHEIALGELRSEIARLRAELEAVREPGAS